MDSVRVCHRNSLDQVYTAILTVIDALRRRRRRNPFRLEKKKWGNLEQRQLFEALGKL